VREEKEGGKEYIKTGREREREGFIVTLDGDRWK